MLLQQNYHMFENISPCRDRKSWLLLQQDNNIYKTTKTSQKHMTLHTKQAFLMLLFLASSFVAGAQTTMPQSDLFQHKRINLYDIKKMPNSKGKQHHDSIVNNRCWRMEQPRLYEYVPGLEERRKTAVIVIPGGGYAKQAYETAGVSTAKWLNTFGVTAFVLLHRLPVQPDVEDGTIAPVMDAQRAVRWVRAHAAEYGIDPDRIGVMGCSSGAHVAACVSSVQDDLSKAGDALDTVDFRPNFSIQISTYINRDDTNIQKTKNPVIASLMSRFNAVNLVNAHTAPTLLIHASDDTAVPSLNSVKLYQLLMENGVTKSSIHVFPFGKHGIALRHQPGTTALWPEIAEKWMEEIGVLE